MGPLTQSQDFCIIFPETGLAQLPGEHFCSVGEAPGRLWGLGWWPWPLWGSRDGCGWGSCWRAPEPLPWRMDPGGWILEDGRGRPRHWDLIFACWIADVSPFGQIDIPIWIVFI